MAQQICPSNAQIIQTAPLTAEIDRLIKARSTQDFLKEPRGFADLILKASGQVEGAILDADTVRRAITLAFIMGVNYDGD